MDEYTNKGKGEYEYNYRSVGLATQSPSFEPTNTNAILLIIEAMS